jgi:hypothetical protein
LIGRWKGSGGRNDSEDPGTIGFFTSDGFSGGLPKTTDFMWKSWSSSELPIAISGGWVGSNVGDEKDWRHWTTTRPFWISWTSFFNASIGWTIGVNSCEFVGSIKVGGSELNVSSDASRSALRRGDWEVDDLTVHTSDFSDSKAHRILVSVKESQITVVDSIGIQTLVLIKDGWCSVGWA